MNFHIDTKGFDSYFYDDSSLRNIFQRGFATRNLNNFINSLFRVKDCKN